MKNIFVILTILKLSITAVCCCAANASEKCLSHGGHTCCYHPEVSIFSHGSKHQKTPENSIDTTPELSG